MKNLKLLLVAVLALGLTGVLMADVDGDEDETVAGTVVWNAQWDFTAVASNSAALAAALSSQYDADSLFIADIQVCNNLDSNDSLSIDAKIKTGLWTLPADYPTDGRKNDGNIATTSDFTILANNFAGTNITHSGDFDDYTLLTATNQEIINSTATGASGVGIENESFDIDCAVLWTG